MMNIPEWYELKNKLLSKEFNTNKLENQFYQRLLVVVGDPNSGSADIIGAYIDAFSSSPRGDESLPLVRLDRRDEDLLKENGLQPNAFWDEISLTNENGLGGREKIIDLKAIYELRKKRHIDKCEIDPSLHRRLKDDRYQHYTGQAQEMAVRLSLTTKNDATLIINLPTGAGKTLVAHALCAFSVGNNITLVIVPTTALAIEQGERALEMLKKMQGGHGGVCYWHSGQDKQLHDEIKERILKGQQKILFCSPEVACRSLLPTLFEAAKNDILANVVIDEAHIVDQWGAAFRPDYQILSAILRSLREISRKGIKVCLMSATFTEKTLKILSELFSVDSNPPIEVHGNFLRPEIQYSVHRVAEDQHHQEVINAIFYLPKPIIVYTVKKREAKDIFDGLRSKGFYRIELFTGDTETSDRQSLLEKWSLDEIDIMVATSAFGMGMDKDNIRSIVHAAVPENLDRFYQEVGRAGRDGRACQSLLIYHDAQFRVAKKINNQRLITAELGLKRWKTMWNAGKEGSSGTKVIDVATLHSEIERTSDQNDEWNWRTLLLMQRSGMVTIEIAPPEPPPWNSDFDVNTNRRKQSDYFEEYYRRIHVSPVIDDHLSSEVWGEKITSQRSYEKDSQERGFDRLKKWIVNADRMPFCQELFEFYTVRNRRPEKVCGGCPGCRKVGRNFDQLPTVGGIVHVIGLDPPKEWPDRMNTKNLHLPIYYDNGGVKDETRLIRHWVDWWISSLLEQGVINAIRSDLSTLEKIDRYLPSGLRKFWVGIPLTADSTDSSYWSELVLVMSSVGFIPDIGWEESPRLLVAPIGIPDQNHYGCKWWEKRHDARSLKNFVASSVI